MATSLTPEVICSAVRAGLRLHDATGKARTLARQPAIVVKTKILLPMCVNIARSANYQRCGYISKTSWNRELLSRYLKARRYRSQIDHDAVSVIRVLSYSRSGSHNFLSRLHYLPSCFVLKENLCPNRDTDHLWLSLTPDDVSATDYMGFSLFGEYGLQQKGGENLRYLATPFNRLLEHPLPQGSNPFPQQDRVLFLVRNFFRMLISRQTAVETHDKAKWFITDEAFYESANAHFQNITAYASMSASEPERFQILGHEVFCARPVDVFRETMKELGVADGSWRSPCEFFVECTDGKTPPVVRDDTLWDPTTATPILGTGGKYNPMRAPSLVRTLRGEPARFFKPEWIRYATKLFGSKLVDLWLSDTPATYESMSTEEYVQMLCELPARPVSCGSGSAP